MASTTRGDSWYNRVSPAPTECLVYSERVMSTIKEATVTKAIGTAVRRSQLDSDEMVNSAISVVLVTLSVAKERRRRRDSGTVVLRARWKYRDVIASRGTKAGWKWSMIDCFYMGEVKSDHSMHHVCFSSTKACDSHAAGSCP